MKIFLKCATLQEAVGLREHTYTHTHACPNQGFRRSLKCHNWLSSSAQAGVRGCLEGLLSGAVGGSWTPNTARFFQLAGPAPFLGGPLAAFRWAFPVT